MVRFDWVFFFVKPKKNKEKHIKKLSCLTTPHSQTLAFNRVRFMLQENYTRTKKKSTSANLNPKHTHGSVWECGCGCFSKYFSLRNVSK
jgi:hypothetical protein